MRLEKTLPLFENVKNNSEITVNPMNTSRAWSIESSMLEIYFLLVKRIKGLGLSLDDFWKLDTWTTSKLYLMELEVMEEEDKAVNGDKEEYHDSPEMVDLYEEMYGIEE